MGMYRHVREISRITQRSIISRLFTHHAATDEVILVNLLVKLSISRIQAKGYVGPLNIFTDHAHLTDQYV
jgi:hypothetical protein